MSKSKPAIEIESLSKQYRLGYVGLDSLGHDFNRWWHTIRGKEDPYLKIGEENDRTSKGHSQYVWALRDISFSVNEGEVLGIIGKNGAGKSTLLKILSRVTGPTTGTIKYNGRLASLLEVGTGFHPELTGRENIYLNGTLLGMTKKEVDAKIDEIIDFAGVERYVDTPAKRYSSGMTVRLGFAVAAFLEPDILVVDEVLAVGDAEFQRKAVGKMKDVASSTGRTVLFVSHNMASVKALCSRCVVLANGRIVFSGPTEEAIDSYLKNYRGNVEANLSMNWENDLINEDSYLRILSTHINESQIGSICHLFVNKSFTLTVNYELLQSESDIDLTLKFYTADDILLFVTSSINESSNRVVFPSGKYSSKVEIPNHLLNSGEYRVDIVFGKAQKYLVKKLESAFILEVTDSPEGRGSNYRKAPGFFRPFLNWETTIKSK